VGTAAEEGHTWSLRHCDDPWVLLLLLAQTPSPFSPVCHSGRLAIAGC
jgi:hypothetical protein